MQNESRETSVINEPRDERKEHSQLKDYMQVGDVFRYFIRLFRKPKPGEPTNFNLRMMHGINKISIIMFLLGVIYLIFKNL